MSESRWQEELIPLLRPLQIVVGALAAGCVVFLVVVLVISRGTTAAEFPLVTYIGIAAAVTALLARTIIPGVIVARGRQKIAQDNCRPPKWPTSERARDVRLQRAGDAGTLWMLFSSTRIVATVILQGAVFLLLVAYMLERSLPGLVVAVAMILTVGLHVPARSWVFRWIEDQLALLEQERQLGG
jgi:hypothetical protein